MLAKSKANLGANVEINHLMKVFLKLFDFELKLSIN